MIIRKARLALTVLLVAGLCFGVWSTASAKTTLRFIGWGSIKERQNVERLIREFEAENPDIAVQWIHVPENYVQRLQVMIAGGTPPDVLWAPTTNYRTYATAGLLYDITGRFESDPVIGAPNYFIEPAERDRMYVDGRAYGIGSTWVSMHLYYNRDMFTKAGVPFPPADPNTGWTWDEFVETAAKLTIDHNGRNALDPNFDKNNIVQWGVNILPTWWLPMFQVAWANGGEIYKADYSEFVIDDKAVEAFQRVADLYERGVAPHARVAESIGMSQHQMLASGRVAMHLDGSWALQDLALMRFPLGTAVFPGKPVTAIQGHMHSIYADTRHPEEAWRLLRFLASRRYQVGLVRVGLWLPSHTEMLTEEGIAEWWNPSVHPAEYRQVGIEYMVKYGRPVIQPPGADQAFQLLTQALDPVWTGRRTARQAIDEVLPELNRTLREARR